MLLSLALVRATVALMPAYIGPFATRISVNGSVLIFSVGVSLVTGILCGLAPAVQCSRPSFVAALKDTSSTNVAGMRMRSFFVFTEVALSVSLLFGAIVTARGFLKAQALTRGFQNVRILTIGLPLSPSRYPTYEARVAFTRSVLERLINVSGVQSAAMANNGLFRFGSLQSSFSIEGVRETPKASLGLVSAGYLRTLGIPLRSGRDLTEQDIASAAQVGLINMEASKRWPAGQSPIGSRIRLDFLTKSDESFLAPVGRTPDVTIVGIFADTKSNDELGVTAAPLVLIPNSLAAPPSRQLFVRTEGNPMLLWNVVRQLVQ